jgi:parallel beta-helix repeat protein
MKPSVASVAITLLFFLVLSTAPALGQVALIPGVRITSAAKVKPGVYRLTDLKDGMVQISGAGFTVDFRGARIVGPGSNQGVGIHITDARNVTLRGANVTGCLWGIVLERCKGVTLVDCVSSRNGDLPPGTVIDESGREPEDQHGGGILLRDCTGCVVRRCAAQHQWDGIDVVRSDGNTIEDGDFSYSGNWGVHFWSSSKNVFRRNRAIWCTTGAGTLYQALTGWSTMDAQAVGMDHASCDNLIEENDLRFGGDGIFIRANEGGVTPGSPVPPLHSSDRNILRRNDCSFSPNNAIEADLIEGTIIEDNNCSNSNYGMWLGYSRGSVVRRNICLNDSSHAIEIENGQNGVIENNLFGFDRDRPDAALVYLRQNGRDRTPSGPYTLRGNRFYGTGRCVQLKDTQADFAGNTVVWTGASAAKFITEETPGRVTETGTRLNPPLATVTHTPRVPSVVTPGTLVRIRGVESGGVPVAVELDGIPVWVRRVSSGGVTFFMPEDFWDRPAPAKAALRVYTAAGWSRPAQVALAWPKGVPRITRISPNPAHIGDTITVEGVDLTGEALLNNRAMAVERAGPGRFTFKVPEGVVVTTRYNLIVWDPDSPDRFSWPVTFGVEVPPEELPHILSATFSPTTLRAGEVLTVTFVVRNNLPAPAMLLTKPAPGFIYEEDQGGWDFEANAERGTLNLRVTSDHPGSHEPGSWPWYFGFDRPRLGPGETVTVTGRIRVETPGVHEFRVGLVPTGHGFIDDNAFRTKITVLPK